MTRRERRASWRDDRAWQAGILIGSALGAAATVVGRRMERTAREGLVDWPAVERFAVGRLGQAPGTLSADELRHVKRLFGIGGLSYGNASARQSGDDFWMSASGVDKSRLREIGRDILLVTGFDAERGVMRISVPPDVKPRRVSVDAIEHLTIYREHPEVGAILHVHGWVPGAVSTEAVYPCGTEELAREVAELVREAPDPGHAVIGLRTTA